MKPIPCFRCSGSGHLEPAVPGGDPEICPNCGGDRVLYRATCPPDKEPISIPSVWDAWPTQTWCSANITCKANI